MDIMELGAIGELVGGVAVIATLLYLAIQIKRNALETRAASSQALTDSINSVNLQFSTIEEATIIGRGWRDFRGLEEGERQLFIQGALAICHVYETVLLREHLGVADRETIVAAKETLKAWFALDGIHQWWATNEFPFTQRFTEFVERECVNPSAGA